MISGHRWGEVFYPFRQKSRPCLGSFKSISLWIFIAILILCSWASKESLASGNSSAPQGNTSIQDAIELSTPGGSVLVSKAANEEIIVINKSIRLIGVKNDGCKPIIKSKGDSNIVITINSDDVYLEDLEISNKNGSASTCIFINSNNNVIKNVTIKGPKGWCFGIYINNGQNNTICKSLISNNKFGIYLDNSTSTNIYDNIISQNLYGIYISKGSAMIAIERNLIESNDVGILCADESLILDILVDKNNKFYKNEIDVACQNMIRLP